MQLHQALLEIADIRERMAATQVFRGYRALVAATTAVFAFVAAGLQSRIVADPAADLGGYVRWWAFVAIASVGVTGFDLAIRWLRDETERERVRILSAVRALLPCLITGALVTAAVVRYRPDLGALLPAIWSLLFSQGLFASAPMLPRGVWAVGGYYAAAGLGLLILGGSGLEPWTMAVTFGVGQVLAAAALWHGRERAHAA